MTTKARKGGIGFTTDEHRLNIAITRPRDAFFVVCDMNTLDDDNAGTRIADADGDDGDDVDHEEELFGAPFTSSKLGWTMDFYRSQGCVVPIKPDDNQEFIDLGPAEAFAKEYQDAKIKRNTCLNCKELGHRASECVNPRKDTRVCKNCNQEGHISSACPTPRVDNRTCSNCQKTGHIGKDRPDPHKENRQCRSCGQYGHIARDYPAPRPENRRCKGCGMLGHTKKDCPKNGKSLRPRPGRNCWRCSGKGVGTDYYYWWLGSSWVLICEKARPGWME